MLIGSFQPMQDSHPFPVHQSLVRKVGWHSLRPKTNKFDRYVKDCAANCCHTGIFKALPGSPLSMHTKVYEEKVQP